MVTAQHFKVEMPVLCYAQFCWPFPMASSPYIIDRWLSFQTKYEKALGSGGAEYMIKKAWACGLVSRRSSAATRTQSDPHPEEWTTAETFVFRWKSSIFQSSKTDLEGWQPLKWGHKSSAFYGQEMNAKQPPMRAHARDCAPPARRGLAAAAVKTKQARELAATPLSRKGEEPAQ